MRRAYLLTLVLALLLTGCMQLAAPVPSPTPAPRTATPEPTINPARTVTPTPTGPRIAEPRTPAVVAPAGLDGALVKGTNGLPWWNDTVFYEIFVRSFYDSNGDGIGDLNGLIEKLDYLNDGDPATTTDLGVTGLWLMPIMDSPSYHGYDVTDYTTVNPQYGTNDDFKRLMAEAHKRGIYVIIDLVMNHTSSKHPWFLEAQDPASPKRDWYIWADERPQGQGWHEGQNGYYYGYFWEGMPDLNYKNPDVTAAMNEVVRFWLEDMGVDGYRLDAIKYLIEEGTQREHTAATLAWLERFYKLYKSIKPDAFTVGEVWNSTDLAQQYVGDKVDVVFEFDLAAAMIDSALKANKQGVANAQAAVTAAYPRGQFATFLANHDQDRVRTRVTDEAKAQMAASLQLLFSGVPFVYYGEEIGMRGSKPDEDIRRPLQWTAEGGFTTGTPWHDYYDDYDKRNIAAQDRDPGSLLNHYRALIRLRAEHEAVRVGEWLPVEVTPAQPGVYASVRHTASEQVLVLLNLGNKPVTDYALTLAAGPFAPGSQPVLLMGTSDTLYAADINAAGGFEDYRPLATLPPRGTFVLQFLP